uniref:Integrase, catalytic region, zinc finger, CCHC-type, peptidase aspartic, catalytic n=1 Tax=Tanacetum cinerariifolium TaxID=118510 RepID=A0A6L2JBU2_TANCI|nr:hypothetical protein [Tanacetum cinerariifolium]
MEVVVDQYSVDKNSFEIQIEQLHIDNDQLLNQIMSQEVVHIDVNSVDILDVSKSYLNAQLQEKVFAITSLQNELRKLKGKTVVDIVVSRPIATTIAPGMFKLDIKPISRRLKNNRDAHEVYLKQTIENTDTVGRTFTIVGNRCPLTRITSTKVVPLKETTIAPVITPTLELKVYSSKLKAIRSVGSSSKSKIVKSKTSNTKEPNQSWGSTVFDVPSSSLNDYRLSKFFFSIWTLDAPSI